MSPNRISRIFDTLDLLLDSPDGMTVTEIGKILDLPISSTHNLLQSLAEVDAVTVSSGPRYSIGSRAVSLGLRVVDSLDVRLTARRHLQDLAQRTHEDIYLAVRHGQTVVYVDRVHGRRSVTVDIRLGQSLLLHATSVGKLFAAYEPSLHARMMRAPRPKLTSQTLTDTADLETELEVIARNGFSLSREEAIEGIVGLAVPVFDARGRLAAAIHISALTAQMTSEREQSLVAEAQTTARSLEADLGRSPARRVNGTTRRAADRPRPSEGG
jgi:DNA-binding IclR family transcriptional regulator